MEHPVKEKAEKDDRIPATSFSMAVISGAVGLAIVVLPQKQDTIKRHLG